MLKDGPVRALGAMSGASLEGVDVAILLTDGVSILEFGDTGSRPYSDDERRVLRAAIATPEDREEAAEIVENAHAELISEFEGFDIVGFHGQSLPQGPHGRSTIQVGSGLILSEVLEAPVVWDFRSADVGMGGNGTPLLPFFHFACAKWIGVAEPVAFLNLGGVGKVSWVDPREDIPNAEGALLAFETGPANTPVNELIQSRLAKPFDEDGALAATGRVSEGVLAAFVEDPYFYKMPPKILDDNDFTGFGHAVNDLSDADAAATLTATAAAAVVKGGEHFPIYPSRMLVTGGGRKNKVLMKMLAAGMDCPVVATEYVGLNGDMMEAQAFAFLAVRVARGLPTSCPATTGVSAAIGGGVISQYSG